MARWVVGPVTGTGTLQDPWRPLAAQYATHWQATDGNDPALPVLMVAFDLDVAAANADPLLDVLPDLHFDDVLTAGQRTGAVAICAKWSAPSGWVMPGITAREVLQTVGRWLQNQYDPSWMGANADA